jgi:hypothetical protein
MLKQQFVPKESSSDGVRETGLTFLFGAVLLLLFGAALAPTLVVLGILFAGIAADWAYGCVNTWTEN